MRMHIHKRWRGEKTFTDEDSDIDCNICSHYLGRGLWTKKNGCGLQEICSQGNICFPYVAYRSCSADFGDDASESRLDIKRRKHDMRRGVDLSSSVEIVDDAMDK